ncbi:AraC family transcriptional regulator [Allomeiothermus silvanus]|uniref:AraC family transcriptional regulator n=1 Tax=Allomeiothermus silvanus TaxID=52022 RepID=UPI0023F2B80D|nr:AraC family transcriptional regulator [Allomeiothermus silvanus]
MLEFAHYKQLGFADALHAHYVTHEFARHSHDFYVVGVVTQGVEAFRLEGSTRYAPAGSVLVVHPGQVHTGYAVQREGWEYRMFYPSIAWVREVAESMGLKDELPRVSDAVLEDLEIAGKLKQAHRVSNNNPLAGETLLSEAMGLLLRRYGGAHPPQRCLPKAAVIQAVQYLRQSVSQPVTLEKLSRVSGLSRFHLVRAFRAYTGLPPHLYLLQLRIEEAKIRLCGPESLAQIALEVGFTDQAHFTKSFKRMVGVTPGVYRKARREAQR